MRPVRTKQGKVLEFRKASAHATPPASAATPLRGMCQRVKSSASWQQSHRPLVFRFPGCPSGPLAWTVPSTKAVKIRLTSFWSPRMERARCISLTADGSLNSTTRESRCSSCPHPAASRSFASRVPSASACSLRQATSRPMGAKPQFVHGKRRSFGTNASALPMVSATS